MNKVNRRRVKVTSFIIIASMLILSSIFIFKNESMGSLIRDVNSEANLKLSINDSSQKGIKDGYDTLVVNSSNYSYKDIELYPGGTPVGVKISTNGVLAVGYSDIEYRDTSFESPARKAGIELGDILLEINDEKIESSKDLSKKINEVTSDEIEVKVIRNGIEVIKKVKLVKNQEEKLKIGLWVRDSTAGVGTLTFYEKSSGKYGALGHPITDNETDKILEVKTGNLIKSSIISVRRGEKGLPGELKGMFINDDSPIGNVVSNTQCGIFGKINSVDKTSKFNKPFKVGYKEDIKLGKAHIISTIDENGPEMYEIEIVKLLSQDTPGPKSMVIKVTDPRLLEKTGGIVQGMSGSPIIQNDKIIGAVTHVLVNKPDVGYGIYIQWMLQDANIIK